MAVGARPTTSQTVTLEAPRDPDRVSSFLNIRVKDIEAVYAEWSARGAQFLTPPKQHQYEIRCYMRDPDGHLIEVGQTTDPKGNSAPAALATEHARRGVRMNAEITGASLRQQFSHALPTQAELLQEQPRLRWPETDPRQLLDAVGRLCHAGNRSFLERLGEQFAMGFQRTASALFPPTPQTFQPAVPICLHESLHRRHADADDLRCFFSRKARGGATTGPPFSAASARGDVSVALLPQSVALPPTNALETRPSLTSIRP